MRFLVLANLRPLPPAPSPGSSITGWIWLTVVLAVIVAGGMILTSRR